MLDLSCRAAQERLCVALVDQTGPRERLEAEDHASRCLRCADAIRDLAALSVALDRAYAPLRSRAVALSPARVHLALRGPARPTSTARIGRLAAKANEVAVAAAVMVFAMLGAVAEPRVDSYADAPVNAGPIRLTQGHVDAPMADRSVSVRIGRYLLHDTLLDPQIVPLERPHLEAPEAARTGQPY